MAYNAKAQKKYNEKTILIAASYKPNTDLADGQRVKAYLEQTGQSANSYILESKKFYQKNNSSIWIYGIFKLPHLRKIQTPRKELFHV